MKEFLLLLRTKAWRTSGSRYNAARRLKRRELFSTVSLSFFSAATVGVAFFQRIYGGTTGTPINDYLSLLSACLGVVLLAISLMEWGSANGAKADALHRNAEDLNAYQLKIAQRLSQMEDGVAMSWDDVEALRNEYETIKNQIPHNHSPLDDMLFRSAHRTSPEFTQSNRNIPAIGRVQSVVIWLKWNASSVWYFSVFWIAICALLTLPLWFNSLFPIGR